MTFWEAFYFWLLWIVNILIFFFLCTYRCILETISRSGITMTQASLWPLSLWAFNVISPSFQALYTQAAAAAAAKSLQSCPTLCNPMDGSPPGSPVPGILQARTLEWVAISFSNAWKWKVKVKSLRHVRLSATPWTAAYQAPLSMGFSRQEY